MKYAIFLVPLLSLAACSVGDTDETLGDSTEALNGALSSEGFLVMPARNFASSEEVLRRADTRAYYSGPRTRLALTGSGPSLSSLGTLQNFKDRYGLNAGSGTAVSYYNKGDLGLGRDMHCREGFPTSGETACYVSNYAAGSDEFTFGLSADIAFDNLANKPPVATVAMVFRDPTLIVASDRDSVIFAVYDGAGALTDTAALDRHGIGFQAAYNLAPGTNPPGLGTPGTNFNNHYPSNCLNCHGGVYAGGSVSAAVFLPFDLDQFQFPALAPPSAAQQTSFRALNQMVRKVASSLSSTSLVTQIDGWYDNSTPLAGNFNSGYVPTAWKNTAGHSDNESVYFNVVRRSCRGCHLTIPNATLHFDTPTDFLNQARLGDFLLNNKMPHALQTQREFWQSNQPVLLENFLVNNGKSAVANQLHSAGPGQIVTLDPPQIASAALF